MVGAVYDKDPGIALTASREVLRLAGVGTDRADASKISALSIKITRTNDKHKDDEVTVEINNA
jgi:hypothetical protein